ncbi:fibronectin type III domain-containing protein [Kibdelosporangium philippinense]|uniref:Fibronectin type III domain-containing protein n=1 Tax=Kibdelosporangium philippinense TaxID=211113 RepID=A0ABS8ZDN3_9PSEU|nr:fibronectin type III domain-containing protein [Kibdelosporangium philippinense]MCE7004975.1 fibronectin type III domain-containing protein [Kibdelosporangium philippinense]
MIRYLAAVSLVVLASCSASPTSDAPNTPAPARTDLTASLTSPLNVDLSWHVVDKSIAGQVIEYSDQENGEYIILDYLPPGQTSYKHADLMPETKFFYRVRAYYGTPSPAVELTLPPGESDENAAQDWLEPSTRPGPAASASARDPQGAPTDFTVTMADRNGVKLTWTDRTTDEEGFFVESKPAGAADFQIAATTEANINTYGLATQPTEKKATYRVVPFKFGEASNIAVQTTGKAA